MPDRDFMGMMGQGAAPGTKDTGISEQEIQELKMNDQDFQEAGLTPGESPEAMKQRLVDFLEQAGVMEGLEASEKQEIMQLVDQLVKDIEAENFEAVQQNPIMQLLAGVMEQFAMEEQGVSPEAAPADMAAMAGPSGMPGGGGGMPPMPGGGM